MVKSLLTVTLQIMLLAPSLPKRSVLPFLCKIKTCVITGNGDSGYTNGKCNARTLLTFEM